MLFNSYIFHESDTKVFWMQIQNFYIHFIA